MDHLLYVLDRIEELLRELMLAEVRGATEEPKGFDIIHSLVRVYCELVNRYRRGWDCHPSRRRLERKEYI